MAASPDSRVVTLAGSGTLVTDTFASNAKGGTPDGVPVERKLSKSLLLVATK
jgi:hypothetical protein